MHCQDFFAHSMESCPYCHSWEHSKAESEKFCLHCNQSRFADSRRRGGMKQKYRECRRSTTPEGLLACIVDGLTRSPDVKPSFFDVCDVCKDKDGGRPGRVEPPKLLIISHTGLFSERRARLRYEEEGVGPHFVISKTGQIRQYIQLEKVAWFAGASWHPQFGERLNRCSVGVMLEGNGESRNFTDEQYELLNLLSKAIDAWAGEHCLVHTCLRDVAGDHVRGEGKGHIAPGRFFAADRVESQMWESKGCVCDTVCPVT